MISDEQRKHYDAAVRYVTNRREQRGENPAAKYPINRGDILSLLVLIEQELKAATPAADPKRLTAIRDKLGDLIPDAPEMSKEEAQGFR